MSEELVTNDALAEHEPCPLCDDSGYAEYVSGGIWTGENIRTRLEICRCIAGGDVRREHEWQPIETAPRDGTWIQAEIPGDGADNVIAWQTDAFLDSGGHDCGGWAFVTEQEPPDSWTDGICWEVNEDGVPSVQPTRWKTLPKETSNAE